MAVADIVSRDEAKRIRKRDDLLRVDEWLVGEEGSGTPLNQHRQLTPELTKQLRFVSKGSDSKAVLFVDDNNLDGQTTRPVRELTIESAFLLDEIIDATDRLPRSSSIMTVTDQHLRQYRTHRDADGLALPEIRGGVIYVEGSVQRILVNRYERDPDAREACIRHYGAVCSICDFDFNAVYGAVATGFIHVHHLIALSSLGVDYSLNPIEDLRPVCPNCHAVVHRRTPPYLISEVQQFISNRSTGD